LGGSAAGRSSELVLPVWCLELGDDSVDRVLVSYFCRMKRSMTPSISSASIGNEGLALRGLYLRFEAALPMPFMFFHFVSAERAMGNGRLTSTCSTLHWSMLSDLTLEMCVPSLRCRAAQRMQRNIPKLQLAQPGFFAPQSAHLSLPGTVLIRS